MASERREAETFSRRGGYAASTLRWWASKLKRDLAAPTLPRYAPREIRIARVVRAEPPATVAAASSALTLELAHVGARIEVPPSADRATLAMMLDVLGAVR